MFALIKLKDIHEKSICIFKKKILPSNLVIWFVCSSSLSGLNPLVDRFIASSIEEGSVSQLELIERLASLFLLIPTVGVLQVLNVEINKKINNFVEWDCVNFLGKILLLAMVWSALCILILWLFHEYLFSIFGGKTWGDVDAFYYGLVILTAMAPALFVGMVGVRILLAMNRGRSVLYLSAFSLVFNAATSFQLGKLFGVNGILIATILTYSVTALFLIFLCSKYFRIMKKTQFSKIQY